MRKKHEENNDVRCLSRNGIKCDERVKVIRANKGSVIGIRSWGRIDFLTHYKGWVFLWDNSVGKTIVLDDNSSPVEKSKIKKELHKLTNKKK